MEVLALALGVLCWSSLVSREGIALKRSSVEAFDAVLRLAVRSGASRLSSASDSAMASCAWLFFLPVPAPSGCSDVVALSAIRARTFLPAGPFPHLRGLYGPIIAFYRGKLCLPNRYPPPAATLMRRSVGPAVGLPDDAGTPDTGPILTHTAIDMA